MDWWQYPPALDDCQAPGTSRYIALAKSAVARADKSAIAPDFIDRVPHFSRSALPEASFDIKFSKRLAFSRIARPGCADYIINPMRLAINPSKCQQIRRNAMNDIAFKQQNIDTLPCIGVVEKAVKRARIFDEQIRNNI
jgi:hypothetical protein